MNKKVSLFLIGIFITQLVFAQQNSSKDSIRIFYDALFENLETAYLYKAKIEWETIKPDFYQAALAKSSLEKSLPIAQALFDSIGCSHCSLFSETGYYPATSKPLLFKDYSTQFQKRYAEGVEFDAYKLTDSIAYMVIPGMLFMDLSVDSMNAITQQMYDKIYQVSQQNTKGWIIDLRFNIGGDAYIMLTALYHLLGNKVVYNLLDVQKEIHTIHRLEEGEFYSGKKVERSIKVAPANPKIPVALIIGNWTASAGECVILGFRGRPKVKLIGDETYGFLTGNDMIELPFGIKAPLTTGYLADMCGHYKPNYKPSICIKDQDNFENLLKDKNIIEALDYLDKVYQEKE